MTRTLITALSIMLLLTASCKKEEDELKKSVIEITVDGQKYSLVQEQEWEDDQAYRRIGEVDGYAYIQFMSTGQSTGNHSDCNISMTFPSGTGTTTINSSEAPDELDQFDYDRFLAINDAEDYYEIDLNWNDERYQFSYSYMHFDRDTMYYNTRINKYGNNTDDKVEGTFEAMLVAEESLTNPNEPPRFIKVSGSINMYASGNSDSWAD